MRSLIRNIGLLPGWRTKRKIIVIESDDWGSIRMSSSQAFQSLLKSGYPIDKDIYNTFDSLESSDDLSALYNVLINFKDHKGNHPIITANTIMANPDFEKIRQNKFSAYYFEKFTITLDKYGKDGDTFQLWQQGIQHRFFRPQFHGREHVNVNHWLNALQQKDSYFLEAFEHGIFGINNSKEGKRCNYMAAFDFSTFAHLDCIKNIVKEGLELFEDIFQFKSLTLIAPCYIWSSDLEGVANQLGVKAIQGIPFQFIPVIGSRSYKKKIHFTGGRNQFGQTYLVRNAFFEPTLDGSKFSIDSTLKRIESAFLWRKPAIIGSHRINFVGSLVEANRTNNLLHLHELLSAILAKWPDVEFMSSDQLYIEMSQ